MYGYPYSCMEDESVPGEASWDRCHFERLAGEGRGCPPFLGAGGAMWAMLAALAMVTADIGSDWSSAMAPQNPSGGRRSVPRPWGDLYGAATSAGVSEGGGMIRSVARGVWWGGAGCRHGGVCEREAGATGASAQRNGKTCA